MISPLFFHNDEGQFIMSIDFARTLRQVSTPPEIKLWEQLRNRRFLGLKFRRQYPVGPYVVDFVCLSQKLIIELDGGQHAEQLVYDGHRTRYLERFGFKVLRFWNNDVLMRFETVLEHVHSSIDI